MNCQYGDICVSRHLWVTTPNSSALIDSLPCGEEEEEEHSKRNHSLSRWFYWVSLWLDFRFIVSYWIYTLITVIHWITLILYFVWHTPNLELPRTQRQWCSQPFEGATTAFQLGWDLDFWLGHCTLILDLFSHFDVSFLLTDDLRCASTILSLGFDGWWWGTKCRRTGGMSNSTKSPSMRWRQWNSDEKE